ncbi:MAG: HD domain-containing protein, partial [Thermosphaera sp.]
MLGGFLKISSISNIRHIPRTGWVLRGVPPSIAETISDHIVLVMLVSLKITEKLLESGYNLDIAKVLIMGLLHDLPETVTGD